MQWKKCIFPICLVAFLLATFGSAYVIRLRILEGWMGEALAMDDEATIRSLLRAFPIPAKARTELGKTPLHWAAQKGDEEAVRLLLSKGADINAFWADVLLWDWGKPTEYFQWRTPLHQAILYGHTGIVRVLIDHGADVNACKKDPIAGKRLWVETPLGTAIMYGGGEMARLLLDAGARADLPAEYDQSPLALAVGTDDLDTVRLLLHHGADIHEIDSDGSTLLHRAAGNGSTSVAEFLLTEGADVNAATDDWRTTPLHEAAANAPPALVALLLSHGAHVNARETATSGNIFAGTPLHAAIRTDRKRNIELLIAHGADVNALTSNGMTSLELARKFGRTDLLDFLRKHGAVEKKGALPPAPSESPKD